MPTTARLSTRLRLVGPGLWTALGGRLVARRSGTGWVLTQRGWPEARVRTLAAARKVASQRAAVRDARNLPVV